MLICCHMKRRAANVGDAAVKGAKAYIGEGKPRRELKSEHASATVLWAGLDSQYFSALMIPDPQLAATYKIYRDATGKCYNRYHCHRTNRNGGTRLTKLLSHSTAEGDACFSALCWTEERYNSKKYRGTECT